MIFSCNNFSFLHGCNLITIFMIFQKVGTVCFFYVRRNGLFFVATSTNEMSPVCVIELLSRQVFYTLFIILNPVLRVNNKNFKKILLY